MNATVNAETKGGGQMLYPSVTLTQKINPQSTRVIISAPNPAPATPHTN